MILLSEYEDEDIYEGKKLVDCKTDDEKFKLYVETNNELLPVFNMSVKNLSENTPDNLQKIQKRLSLFQEAVFNIEEVLQHVLPDRALSGYEYQGKKFIECNNSGEQVELLTQAQNEWLDIFKNMVLILDRKIPNMQKLQERLNFIQEMISIIEDTFIYILPGFYIQF
jgi:hypothetical protein